MVVPTRETLLPIPRDDDDDDGSEDLDTETSEFSVVHEAKLEWVNLEQDVYGAGIYTIIHDTRELFYASNDDIADPVNCLRVSFCVMGLLFNYVMQGLTLYFTYTYVTLPSIRNAQHLYRRYHAEVYEKDGHFNWTKWDAWGEKNRAEVCNMVFSNFWFLYSILVLWWMTIMHEIRECERLARGIWNMPAASSMVNAVYEKDGEERFGAVTCILRMELLLLICLPKFLIACALLVLGTLWLAATRSVTDLLLNAIALEFIVEIDETIYNALFPATLQKYIGDARLGQVAPKATQWAVGLGYARSIFYAMLIFCGVALWLTPTGQQTPFVNVLPQYAYDADCPQFWEQEHTMICKPGMEDCYPYGS